MVPLNDFRRQWAELREETLTAFEAVGESGWYILGAEVRQFEDAPADYWGLRHAVGVAQGPMTVFATPPAVPRLGAIPVFIGCESVGLIDLDASRELLDAHSGVTCCVPVHLYENCVDLGRLLAPRDDSGLSAVEDCAQSTGACWGARKTGSVSRMEAASFRPTRNLGALGDGGAVPTDCGALSQEARALQDYGQSRKCCRDRMDWNSRPDESRAAVLRRVLLPDGEGRQTRRFCREDASLPIQPCLTGSEMDQVIAACDGWRR